VEDEGTRCSKDSSNQRNPTKMESQQIVELLLAMRQEMDANTNAMQELQDMMKDYREDINLAKPK
jgi:hypothetical protein